MNLSSCPDVVIQFDPTGYVVAEGSSTMLRVVKIGVADVTVSVSLSTMVETAGDLSKHQILCVYISKYAITPAQFSKKETMVVSIEARAYYNGPLSCSSFWVATQLLIMNLLAMW